MSKFKFFCFYCGQKLEAKRRWIGKTIKCPSCSKMLQIPAPERVCRFCRTALKISDNICPHCHGELSNSGTSLKLAAAVVLVILLALATAVFVNFN